MKPNYIISLRTRWLIDDISHFAAILSFVAAMYAVPAMITMNLMTSGTTVYYRTRKEENNESLEDNCMTDQYQPEADTVHTPLGPIIHERCMVTKQGKLTGFRDLKAWYESTPHHHLTTAN